MILNAIRGGGRIVDFCSYLSNMIRLFSQIRNKLLDNGKARNYILYAAGEVFLVMIGILLALQVNNWNNDRQRRSLEIEIYEELLTDLKLSREEIESDMNYHRVMLNSSHEIMWHLIERLPYDSTVGPKFGHTLHDLQFFPKTSGFENLNSLGLDLITNDSIRIAITNLYQLDFLRLIEMGRKHNIDNNIARMMRPYILKHWKVDPSTEWTIFEQVDPMIIPGLQPIDYEALLTDEGYRTSLHETMRIRSSKIIFHQRVLDNIEKVDGMIREELLRIK